MNSTSTNKIRTGSNRSQLIELLSPRLVEARSLANTLNLLKFPLKQPAQPLNFALTPSPISPETLTQLIELTPHFNRLIHAIAQDHSFLREALETTEDPFVKCLLSLLPACDTQPLKLYLNRHDFFISPATPIDLSPDHSSVPVFVPKLVEINTQSVSCVALASRIHQLHHFLLHKTSWLANLVNNPCLKNTADSLTAAFHKCDHKNSYFLMVVQPDETNLADQHLLEQELIQRDVPVRRMTLSNIGQEGRLKNADLWIGNIKIAVACFRSGYRPEDIAHPDAWKGRKLLAHSSTVEIPDAAGQLAGLKKTQQLLCQPDLLKRFAPNCPPDLPKTLTPMYSLDEPLRDGLPAWKKALESPHEFVLKPQREGGGHNLFNQALSQKLNQLSPSERQAWVLMSKIHPVTHQTILVTSHSGSVLPLKSVSEIGRFGILLAEGERDIINQDIGFLVRTKPEHYDEGGVSSGYGSLDSLLYDSV